MWLLSTERAELHHFVSPDAIEEGYAILSHVWDAQEQSFKDIRKLQKKCALTGDTPRNFASEKVRRCCETAEQYGYKWVWLDSCCIDKTSSAELSEAINSMFRYYSLSQVCFVYMADVNISRLPSSFYESRWHTRGWTLQELIAPPTTYFLYSDWTLLGTKFGVAHAIEEITRIPSSLLLGYTRLTDYSVAQRLSWAANRKTTRVEDEAYCLFGLLDVNMPTLYGEGRRAFERLQEEILKQSPDTTVFAWGEPIPIDLLLGAATTTIATSGCSGWAGLFAPSPAAFTRSGSITYGLPPVPPGPSSGQDHMVEQICLAGDHVRSFSVTPHGILAHIPVVEDNGLLIADMFWSDGGRNPLALVLRRLPQMPNRMVPLHAVGIMDSPPRAIAQCQRPAFDGLNWVWRNVYIAKSGATPARIPILEDCGSFIPFSHVFISPFRFPEAAIDSFGAAYDTRIAVRTPGRVNVSISDLTQPWPWTDGKPVRFTFYKLDSEPCYVIQLGVCKLLRAPWSQPQLIASPGQSPYLGECWANVRFVEQRQNNTCSPPYHACPEDHVSTWAGLKKMFTALPGEATASPVFTAKGIELAFELCPLNPDGTFVLKEPPRRLEVPLDVQNTFFEPEPV
ncbi:HET-domain-containing protein [Lentinus brumalis]|uniref:HET-domain-containing protein n=1 Tax=Lentinus brumalis TaxID=2498619 RepID=A0A371DA05_9APHY|nr:HET-domain-containing protein [Polyporus brumalis]